MEIKIKDKLLGNKRFGTVKKIETTYQTILEKFHVKPETILSDLESIPYEITQKSRSDLLEIERRRVHALIEYNHRGIR
jgi:hypothetical protein